MRIVYIEADDSVVVTNPEVRLTNIADVKSTDHNLEALIGEIRLVVLSPDTAQTIISISDIIDAIHRGWQDVLVINLSATNIIIKYKKPVKERNKKAGNVLRVIFVSILCFFGAAFTIMAFGNDVGIPDIFAYVYFLITGKESDGTTLLELSYSVGLMVGVIYFFHHFGKHKSNMDPTPVEVSIKKYEKDSYDVMTQLSKHKKREEN